MNPCPGKHQLQSCELNSLASDFWREKENASQCMVLFLSSSLRARGVARFAVTKGLPLGQASELSPSDSPVILGDSLVKCLEGE